MGCDKCFGQVSVSAGCMCALPASDYINGNKPHMQCCFSIDDKFMLHSTITVRSKVGPAQVLREYSCRILFCSQAAVSVQSSLKHCECHLTLIVIFLAKDLCGFSSCIFMIYDCTINPGAGSHCECWTIKFPLIFFFL